MVCHMSDTVSTRCTINRFYAYDITKLKTCPPVEAGMYHCNRQQQIQTADLCTGERHAKVNDTRMQNLHRLCSVFPRLQNDIM